MFSENVLVQEHGEIVSRNALLRKSTAPAFMARIVIGMSSWPVMITQSPLFSADSATMTVTAVNFFQLKRAISKSENN